MRFEAFVLAVILGAMPTLGIRVEKIVETRTHKADVYVKQRFNGHRAGVVVFALPNTLAMNLVSSLVASTPELASEISAKTALTEFCNRIVERSLNNVNWSNTQICTPTVCLELGIEASYPTTWHRFVMEQDEFAVAVIYDETGDYH